jgi:hypothetical protein
MSHVSIAKRVVAASCIAFAAAVVAGGVGYAANIRNIMMMDACDPETFNAVLGDGACVRNGGVSFADFIEELEATQKAGAWHFAAGQVRLREGQEFQATNHGGEVHTFTEVAQFGGGFVTELNAISGNPVPAPECLNFGAIEFIPPGGNTEPEDEDAGTHHYQCCIHPWMRADVIVR